MCGAHRVAAAGNSSEHGVIRVVRREARRHFASAVGAGLELRMDLIDRPACAEAAVSLISGSVTDSEAKGLLARAGKQWLSGVDTVGHH